MKHNILMMTFFVGAALSLGCAPQETKTDEEAIKVQPNPIELKKVKKEVKEAMQAMQDYPYTRKAEFVADTQKELGDIQTELDQVVAGLNRSKREARDDARVRFNVVRDKLNLVKAQLDQANDATEDTWNDVKGAIKKSRSELKESFEKSRRWLSEK